VAVGQVHDEILALGEEACPEVTAVELKWAMEQSPKWMPTLKLRAEVSCGKDWNSAKT